MAWQTPKTDWIATDFMNVANFNRIKNNLAYLKDYAQTLYSFPVSDLPTDESISGFPYAETLNSIETILEEINNGTYNFDIGEKQTFFPNGHPWDFEEVNRIESATLKIYNALILEEKALPHLEIRLGKKQLGMKI